MHLAPAATPAIQKMQNFYRLTPQAPLYQKEFGCYVLDRWVQQGHLLAYDQVDDYQAYLAEVFGYDQPALANLHGLGWCEAEFMPAYEEKVLEQRGDYELVQDVAGRQVLYFKNARNGFMPQYKSHPVRDWKTWQEEVLPRLNPNTPGRMQARDAERRRAAEQSAMGMPVVQRAIGGYMYLRSLIGPEDLLYMFYDDPQLVHACMQAWLALCDAVCAYHQQAVDIDELFLGEDICYKGGALISPQMMQEFILPYYQQLYHNICARNRTPGRRVHFQIDTDGYCHDVLPLYRSLGCDYFSPFEVAAGCDIVAIGRQYPDLLLSGGIDKRVLAQSPQAIDQMIRTVVEPLFRRGGFIPTCDHGVPAEVSFENYMHYRRRMAEFGPAGC